jgi:hypothetical protein
MRGLQVAVTSKTDSSPLRRRTGQTDHADPPGRLVGCEARMARLRRVWLIREIIGG